MHTILKRGVLFLVAVLLQACGGFSINDSNMFQKGMPEVQVLELSTRSPKDIYTINLKSDPSRAFKVLLFDLQLGDITADYLAVFENDKLLYWGYPYEFNRHPDPLLNEISRVALEKR